MKCELKTMRLVLISDHHGFLKTCIRMKLSSGIFSKEIAFPGERALQHWGIFITGKSKGIRTTI
jgi:hypothetical protein